MRAAKVKYRSDARKRRVRSVKNGAETVGTVLLVLVGVYIAFRLVFGFFHWASTDSENRERRQKQEEKAQAEAAQQHWDQSRASGTNWAVKYDATHTDCDARVGTKALETEGWDQKAWLEGCTEQADKAAAEG